MIGGIGWYLGGGSVTQIVDANILVMDDDEIQLTIEDPIVIALEPDDMKLTIADEPQIMTDEGVNIVV